MKKILKSFKAWSILATSMILLPIGLALFEPSPFQKVNAIKVVEGDVACPKLTVKASPNILSLIKSIPFKKKSQMIYNVLPSEKFRKTILEGNGNCSNFVFGMAYDLISKKIDFQIIHLLNKSNGMFLLGAGHTVIRTPLQEEGFKGVGLVDVQMGGVLVNKMVSALDIPDLVIPTTRKLYQLNMSSEFQKIPLYSNLYSDSYILEKVVVSCIYSEDVQHYFQFLETIYIPLGSEKIEKYVFDGLALLFGFYPTINVTQIKFDELYLDGVGIKYVVHRTALFSLRLGVTLAIILVLSYIFLFFRRYLIKSSNSG